MQLNALLAIPMAAALMAYKGAMHLVDATGTSAETIAYRFVESRSLFLRRKEEQKKNATIGDVEIVFGGRLLFQAARPRGPYQPLSCSRTGQRYKYRHAPTKTFS